MRNQTIELDSAANRSNHQVRLSVISGPHRGLHWTFDRPGQITIGREAPSNIVLKEEKAFSRVHLTLNVLFPGAELIDRESRNGTLVNGIRLAEATLQDGDRFGVGDTVILFESYLADDARPAPNALAGSDSVDGDTLVQPQAQPKPIDDRAPAEKTRVGAMARNGEGDAELSPTRVSASATHDPATQGDLSFTPEPQPTIDLERPDVGSEVGSYTLTDSIGTGGMAQVFRAQHRRTKQIVALKLIRSDLAHTEKQIQMFVREAAVLTKLDHPRIVKAIEFGVDRNTPFLIMEHVPCIDLLDLIDTQSPDQRIRTSIWVITRVLQALHYLHNNGIVHRDVKPGNILAFKEEHRLHIKLADFGLAKVFADAGYSGITGEGSVRGTITYMSPEHFRDSRNCGPSDDLFSCGACLYRLLTGNIPNLVFRPEETLEQLHSADMPLHLREAILRAIDVNPNNRFQKADEFAEALSRG